MEEENPGSKVNVPVKKPPKVHKKRALVWKHYEISTDDQGKQIAYCKRCRLQFVAEGTDGTSHVTRHQETCTGRQDGAPPTIPAAPLLGASPESSNCSKDANLEEATAFKARQDGAPPPIFASPRASPESSNCSKDAKWAEATSDLARMIVLRGYDPSFVEDSYFRNFVRILNPDFQVPSRAAIEDICNGVFVEARGVLRSELEHTSGKVNLAFHTAETALGEVLYATCHFIDDDWNRRLMILDARPVVPVGMGPLPLSVNSQMFGKTISDFPTSDLVFSKVLFGTDINCLDEWLDVKRKWFDVDAHYETTCDLNYGLQTVASCFFNMFSKDFIYKTFADTKYLNNETTQERGQIYSQLGLDHLPTYEKEWVSFYFSLQLVCKRQKEGDFHSPVCKSEELRCTVFGELYHASKTISDPNRPTSNVVLREIFKVRETLQSSLAHADVLHSERDLWDATVDVLKHTVQILDECIDEYYLQWSIPLVLDPRYKLKYIKFLFNRAFSSEAEEYVDVITEEIQELFTSFSIDGAETPDADPVHETEITSTHQLQQAWSEHQQRSEVTKTELERYLEGPLMKDTDDFDILNWWKLNSSKYPTLARMARAALAMPTCSKLSSEQMPQITSMIRGYSKRILDN